MEVGGSYQMLASPSHQPSGKNNLAIAYSRPGSRTFLLFFVFPIFLLLPFFFFLLLCLFLLSFPHFPIFSSHFLFPFNFFLFLLSFLTLYSSFPLTSYLPPFVLATTKQHLTNIHFRFVKHLMQPLSYFKFTNLSQSNL